MSKGHTFRSLMNARLTAAAEEIYALFERTIAEYEEELCRFKKENERRQQLLDSRAPLHTEDVQIQTELPPQEKVEDDLCQDVTRVVVKSEYEDISDNEENSEPPCSSSAQQMDTDTDQSQKDQSANDDLCGRAAVDKTNECPICQKKMTRRHMLVHTGEKPYSCSEKRFRQKRNLKAHVEPHTDATETIENEEETGAEELHDADARVSSPEIEIEIEDDNQVCQKDSDKATDAAQNSNGYNPPEFPAKAGPSLEEVHIKEEWLQEFSMSVKSEEQSEHGEEEEIDYGNWIQNWEPSSSSYDTVDTNNVENTHKGSSLIKSMLSTNKTATKKKNPVKKISSNAKTKHECSVCKKKLGRKQELKRHMLLHTGEKPFSCPVCEKRFIQKSNLKSHIVTHLDSVDTFLRHQKPTDAEGGGVNSSDTDNDSDWETTPHTQTKHYSQEPEEQDSFPFVKSVEEDQSTLEQISLLLNQALSESKDRGKTTEYQCPICAKIFGRMENLRRHLLIHTGEKPFSCSVCNKCFKLKQHLKLHMVVHTGEKRFNCSMCTKTFNRKDNLRSHVKVHSIDRPFGCSECGARFNLNKNLMRHMAVHTGQKPYSCTVCNSAFSSQLCLKRHVKIHKKDTPK